MLETALDYYLDVLEVNQVLQDKLDASNTEGLNQLRAEQDAYLAKSEQLTGMLREVPSTLGTRLKAIQATVSEQEGLFAMEYC